MINYLIIESKYKIEPLKQVITEMMSEIIDIDEMIEDERHLIMIYRYQAEVSLKEVIINLATDALEDIRMYESYEFKNKDYLLKHLEFIKNCLNDIPFHKFIYLDDLIIAKTLMTTINSKDYHFFLRDFNDHQDMKHTIKVYLESNQNMSEASKKLFIHRNTLIQRIEKFVHETGFDIRMFVPGAIIYYFLTH